jgi:hypothetical protein
MKKPSYLITLVRLFDYLWFLLSNNKIQPRLGMEISVLDESKWQWVLTFSNPNMDQNGCAPQILCKSRVTFVDEQPAIKYDDQTMFLGNAPMVQHWPLYAILERDGQEAPFALIARYYIDDNKIAHVPFFELWVQSSLFLQQMTSVGRIPREVLVNKVFRIGMSHAFGSQHLVNLLKTRQHDSSSILEWMLRVEQNIKQGHNTIQLDNKCLPIGTTGWVYDPVRDYLRMAADEKDENLSISYRGGILSSADCSSVIMSLLSNNCASELREETTYVPSSATLLVVPLETSYQWEQKLRGMSVLRLLSWNDVEKTTCQELQTAQVILTTYHLLTTKKYHDAVEQFCRQQLADPNSQSYYMMLPSVMRAATRAAKLSSIKDAFTPLQCFRFQRVIYMDMEKLFVCGQKRPIRIVPNLDSQITWGCSPCLNIGSTGCFEKYAQVIHCEAPLWTPSLMDNLVRHAFAQIETEVPPRIIPEHIVSVQLSAAERQLLHYYACEAKRKFSTMEQVQLCTYPYALPSDNIPTKSLAEVVQIVQREEHKKVANLKPNLQEHQHRLSTLEEEHKTGRISLSLLAAERQHLQHCITNISKDLETCEKKWQYFQQACHDKPTKCPVCMEEDTNTVTKCGHWFCFTCLMVHFHTQQKCPLCQHYLRWEDAYQIQETLHNHYGTKLNAVLQHIQQNSQQQFVIGVKFLPLWRLLRTLLPEQKIGCAVLTGNPRTRQCALGRFNRGESQVLLVKLGDTSCGMDIQKGSVHLLFLHALTGDSYQKKEAYQSVWALFGKQGPVDITWFLAKDTVEERIYNAQ